MSLDTKLREMHLLQQELRTMMDDFGSKGGGGGAGSDARLARVETRLDKLGDDVGGLSGRVNTLAERVAHLPSKGYVDARLLGMLVLIAALITFGEKLQALVR